MTTTTENAVDREKTLEDWIQREAAARVLYVIGQVWEWYKPEGLGGAGEIDWETYGGDLTSDKLFDELFPDREDDGRLAANDTDTTSRFPSARADAERSDNGLASSRTRVSRYLRHGVSNARARSRPDPVRTHEVFRRTKELFHGAEPIGVLLAAFVAAVIVAPSALAQPSDTTLFTDDFESGSLANWTVTTAANGSARVEAKVGYGGMMGARMTVPDYDVGSIGGRLDRREHRCLGGARAELRRDRRAAARADGAGVERAQDGGRARRAR
jgi:hypothetical protein